MCHFITATLRRSADTGAFRELVEKHGLAFSPLANDFVQRQLEPDEAYFRATRGHCDCGTALVRRRPQSPEPKERKLRELRQRGWSESKIERWQKSKAPGAKARGTRPTPDEWRAFIDDVLASGVGHVGLLVHWYSGGLADERVEIQQRVTLPTTDPAWSAGLEEDVLYRFSAGAPRRQ